MKLSTRMVSQYKLASLLWLSMQLKVRNLVEFHLQLNRNTLVALWNTAEAGKKKTIMFMVVSHTMIQVSQL